ncbi:type II secretion system protein N [uncultured Sphingomonas sp.]|uniref:type II secretion system protein N n=1 Tax=uncultured Sphingomonas sp. TaxID=158754 RepID=UPI0026268D87|nr:type II secretion system protein N [uncultured Sphingomonas sp.]
MRRLPTANARSLAELALVAGLAVEVARLAWAVVTPIAPLGDWRSIAPTIPAAPADVLRGFDPFYRLGGQGDGAPAVVTSLHLTLFGTRINEATGRGSAILAGPDGEQKSVNVGDEIIAGVVLKEVAFDHVTIERGGAREDLFLDQSASGAGAGAPLPGASGPGVSSAPSPSATGEAITIEKFQADVGLVPRVDGGRIVGLVVRPQGSGAAFRAAGLKEGDIITSIGGRPVNNLADFDNVAAGLSEGGTLSLSVSRNGRTVALSVPVATR